jgi:hypothetical protein
MQWTKNFMADQGYNLETLIKEVNKTTMISMKNGRLSLWKRTNKNLDIRYFFVKDLIDKEIIRM